MGDKERAVIELLENAGLDVVDGAIPQYGDGFRWRVKVRVEDPEGGQRIVVAAIGSETVEDWLVYGNLFRLPDDGVFTSVDEINRQHSEGAAKIDEVGEIINRIEAVWEDEMGRVEDVTEMIRSWLNSKRQ